MLQTHAEHCGTAALGGRSTGAAGFRLEAQSGPTFNPNITVGFGRYS